MADLHDWLNALPCRHLLTILDCCFAGAFTWYARRPLEIVPDVIYREQYERFLREPAWQILTSTAYNQEALDVLSGRTIGVRTEIGEGAGWHSPFALALLAALDETGRADLIPKGQGDGVITASELYLFLRYHVEAEVAAVAGCYQTPELWPFSREKHGKGEYVFLVPGKGEPHLESAPALSVDNNPYRGLQSYSEEHAELFFGRAQLVQELTPIIETHPFTVVLGASGTGKSSLVKAGLLPNLRAQEHDNTAWCILPIVRPTATPLLQLSHAVATMPAVSPLSDDQPDLSDRGNAEEEINNDLLFAADQSQTVADQIEGQIGKWLANNPSRRLLLIIDQFEELITLCRRVEERTCFLTLLAHLLDAHPDQVHIIATLRTDFEPQLASSPLSRHWTRFVVPPMSQAELRAVIEGPASKRAIFFDPPALVDTLVDEVVQMPGALPLLSFTLSELYLKYLERQQAAKRDNVIIERSLTADDYTRIGGVVGSLRTRADELCKQLDADQRASLRRVMLRMVAFEGSELTSRRVPLQELTYCSEEENHRVHDILQRLTDARLVVSGSSETEEGVPQPYVEPAHDALVRAWGILSDWLHQAEADLPLQIQRRLTQAATDWSKAPATKRKGGLLWDNDPRLPQIQHILDTEAPCQSTLRRWLSPAICNFVLWLWPSAAMNTLSNRLNALETEFVRQSVIQRVRNAKRRRLIILAVVASLTALTVVALLQRNVAVEQRNAAQTNESRLLAANALQQLTQDPVSSIVLSIQALPADGARPLVPAAEFALAQALRVNQERAYVTTTVTTIGQVAVGDHAIAVGGARLQLLNFQFEPVATLSDGTVDGVRWSDDGRLLFYVGGQVQVWAGPDRLTSLGFGEGSVVCGAEWRPQHNELAACVKTLHEVQVWIDEPYFGVESSRRLIVPDLDVTAPVADERHVLRWSPDGRYLAAGGDALFLWDSVTDILTMLPGTSGSHIQFVEWSPGSDYLLGAWAGMQTAYIWPTMSLSDPIGVELVAKIEGGGFWNNRLQEQLEVLILDNEGATHRFTLTGQLIKVINDPDIRGRGVGFAVNGTEDRVLTYLDSGMAYLWTADTDAKPLSWRHAGAIAQAAWNGEYVATIGMDGAARVWDGRNGALLTTLPGHQGRMLGVAWIDGRFLLTFDAQQSPQQQPGSLRLWEVLDAAYEPVCRQPETTAPPECRFYSQPLLENSADAPSTIAWFTDEVIWIEEESGALQRWRLDASGQLQQTHALDAPWGAKREIPPNIAWSPQGDQALAYGDFGAEIWMLPPEDLHATQMLTQPIANAAWLEEGIVVADDSDRLFWISQTDEPRRYDLFELTDVATPTYGFAFADVLPDRQLVVVDNNDNIRVWELAFPPTEPILSVSRSALFADSGFADSERPITDVQMSHDGRYLFLVIESQYVAPVNLESGRLRPIWPFPDSSTVASASVAAHPTRPLLAALHKHVLFLLEISPDGTLSEIWKSKSEGKTAKLAWNKDGTRLVTWGDNTAIIWQRDTEQRGLAQVLHLPHTNINISPLFTDDGAHMLTVDVDWGVRLWETWLDWRQMIAVARRSCTRCNAH
ncbi:MAG: hypothetical protein ACK4SA_10175 [Caldilinea sp.]